ncbi:hypothetical protein [Streptomyces sp. R44]|uniref:Uncharacterized protein n=1 Tax=Streptomyces sp. R44 TaxID=3238633 RepID=A0AB39T0B8_9ACTN
MTTSELPRRTPGSSGRIHHSPDPTPGAPSRALRMRAVAGWVTFMRRAEVGAVRETKT